MLANAGLGAVHGLVAPLGGLCDVAHGNGCARLLPATFRVNAQAIHRRQPHSPAYGAAPRTGSLLTDGGNDIEGAVERLSALRRNLGIRSLEEQGVHVQQFAHIVSQSRWSTAKNLIELTMHESWLSLDGVMHISSF